MNYINLSEIHLLVFYSVLFIVYIYLKRINLAALTLFSAAVSIFAFCNVSAITKAVYQLASKSYVHEVKIIMGMQNKLITFCVVSVCTVLALFLFFVMATDKYHSIFLCFLIIISVVVIFVRVFLFSIGNTMAWRYYWKYSTPTVNTLILLYVIPISVNKLIANKK